MVHFKLDSWPVKKQLSSDTKLPGSLRDSTAASRGPQGPAGPPRDRMCDNSRFREETSFELLSLNCERVILHLRSEDAEHCGDIRETLSAVLQVSTAPRAHTDLKDVIYILF